VASVHQLLWKIAPALPPPAFIRILPQKANNLWFAFQKDLKCLWHIGLEGIGAAAA
jgi:hypothetical protein